MRCQICKEKEATRKVSYMGAELREFKLCKYCSKKLWDGTNSIFCLKDFVTVTGCYILFEEV